MMRHIGRSGLLYLLAALVLGGGATALATWAGSTGVGADSTWSQGVSLRNGSTSGAGRVYVGGGIEGGK